MTQHLSSPSHVVKTPIHTPFKQPPSHSFTSTTTIIPQQPIQLTAAQPPPPYSPYSSFLQPNTLFTPHQPPQTQLTPQIPYQNLSQIPPLSTFRSPKLEFTLFDGTNPLEWLFKADQYFSFYNLPLENRLSMMFFYMKGDALG